MELVKLSIGYVSGNSYNFKFNLIQSCEDLGFFDVLDDPLSNVTVSPYFAGTAIVTGTTTSKLEEIRTYSTSLDLTKRYRSSTEVTSNGLVQSESFSGATSQKYVYYVDGITYTTTVENNIETTVFSYQTKADAETANFTRLPIIKDENKLNIIDSPTVTSEIFLERQQISVFENNYRLAAVTSIQKLQKYGGGYFNIIQNT